MRSCHTSTCASVRGAGADADHRDVQGLGHLCGELGRHDLQHQGERADVLQRPGLPQQRRASLAAALHAVAAEHVHRLRRQAEVAHHRHPGGDERLDLGQHPAPPSSLTAWAPASLRNRALVASACSGEAW